MNSKSSALLALLIIVILIVIIAVWWSYNCEPEKCRDKCEKPCEGYTKKNCRTVYSPQPCEDAGSDGESDLPADPWDKHSCTMKQYGYAS